MRRQRIITKAKLKAGDGLILDRDRGRLINSSWLSIPSQVSWAATVPQFWTSLLRSSPHLPIHPILPDGHWHDHKEAQMFYPCLLVSVWFSSSVCPPVCLYWFPSGSGYLSLSLWSELLSTSSRPLLSDITHILLSLFPPRVLVYILCNPYGRQAKCWWGFCCYPKVSAEQLWVQSKTAGPPAAAAVSSFLLTFPAPSVCYACTLPPQSSPFLQQCVRALVLCSNHNCCGFYSLWIISPNHYLFIFTEGINRLVGKGLFFSVITYNDTLLIHPLVLYTSPGSWHL